MGQIITSLKNHMTQNVCLYRNQFEYPISYVRACDFNPMGYMRADADKSWDKNVKKMTSHEYVTRDLLLPIINKRVKSFYSSQKYNLSDIDNLLQKFPEWSERRIFRAHDLYQVFEIDGDGLIDIAEMNLGLDNLSDKTSAKTRLDVLYANDADDTGTIDFEEFLLILYELEVMRVDEHPLKKTFKKIDFDVQFISILSVVQQVRAGFL